MTLSELHNRALRYMRGVFNQNGSLPVSFFALDRQKNLHILVCPEYAAKRGFFEMIMRVYFHHFGVTAYGTATEAWMAHTTEDETEIDEFGRIHMKPGKLTASQRPDRQEILVTSAIDATDTLFRTFDIDRRNGKARVGKERAIAEQGFSEIPRVGLQGFLVGLDKFNPSKDAPGILENVIIPELVRREYFLIRKIIPLHEYDRERN